MRKLLLGTIVFLLVMSYARSDEPKFHYNDCVKVTAGFYRDCVGKVRGMHFGDQFEVALTCKGSDNTIQSVDSKDLKLQDDKVCEGK